MQYLPHFFLFIFGIIFGSFLNVLIDRFSTGRSVVRGRSYCEHCKKTLSSVELIPLVSFLLQKGKCKHCKAKIPPRLFIVEFLIGVLFPLLYLYQQQTQLSPVSIIFLGIIIIFLIGIFFADITYGLIPDKMVIIILFSVVVYLLSINAPLLSHLMSAFGALLFFLTLFVVTKGKGMGFGDVKLSFVLGLLLGFPLIVLCLYLAFLTGAVVSIILVIWKKLRFFGGTIPFGPFLVIATIVSLFFGNQLLLPFLMKFL
jgi:prepilin signal peptidase PulO-like enzyme (type II secretory pathway)